MKTSFFAVVLAVVGSSSPAYAQSSYYRASSDYRSRPTTAQMSTAGVAAAGTATLTGLAIRDVSLGNKTVESATSAIYPFGIESRLRDAEPEVISDTRLQGLGQHVKSDDEVHFTHRVSDAENRRLHIVDWQNEIRSLESSVAHHNMQAAQALIPWVEEIPEKKDDTGRVISRAQKIFHPTPSDLAISVWHTAQAESARADIGRAEKTIRGIADGSLTPEWKIFQIEYDMRESKMSDVMAKIRGIQSEGGRVYGVSRIPRTALDARDTLRGKAALKGAGAVALFALGIEELTHGFLANTAEETVGLRERAR